MFSRLGLLLFVFAGLGVPSQAQAPPENLPLETLKLKKGGELKGVVLFDFRGQVDFAEIQRPAGKPMYAVVRTHRAGDVEKVQRLPDVEHRQLIEQFRTFRQRLQVEAVRTEQVPLETVVEAGQTLHRYQGPWFTLQSTADAETTRRCVVPIEQLFLAYRNLWPPKVDRPATLTIELFGSFDAYRRQLKQWDLELESPAFFAVPHNRIVAGCELDAFNRQLAAVKGEHHQQLQLFNRLDSELPKTLARLSDELKQAGYGDEEVAGEIRQRRAAWKLELAAVRARIQETDRKNDAKFGEVTRKMFRRLAHEAWHAYLENYVCPHEQHRVPSWLNEGLAQVFETGQLEGESYRLDAPDLERLAALQADLAGGGLKLADVIGADEEAFLLGHGGAKSQRQYLYAWGLAWHLAVAENRLGGEALERYLADDKQPPLVRFERFIGRPLPDFERTWRQAMAGLKKP